MLDAPLKEVLLKITMYLLLHLPFLLFCFSYIEQDVQCRVLPHTLMGFHDTRLWCGVYRKKLHHFHEHPLKHSRLLRILFPQSNITVSFSITCDCSLLMSSTHTQSVSSSFCHHSVNTQFISSWLNPSLFWWLTLKQRVSDVVMKKIIAVFMD